MSRFVLLLSKEWRALASDGRFTVLLLLWCVLSAAAAAVSAMNDERAARERADVASATREQWDGQGDKHPHRGAHFGLYVLRERTALGAFDPGVGQTVGQALYLEPHRRNVPLFSGLADEPGTAALVRLSPAWMVEVLLPLLVLVLAFATVTSEREAGTLRMLQAVGAPRTAWLMAKVVAVAGCVTLAAVPALAIPLWLGPGSAGQDTASRAVVLAASVAGVALVHAALGVSISCWSRDSRTALLAALALWATTTLVLPRLGAEYARHQAPAPHAASFWSGIAAEVRDGLPGEPTPAQRLKSFEQEMLRAHGVSRAEDLPVGFLALRRLFRDELADAVHDRHFARLWDTYHRQQLLALAGSAASPAVAWRAVSMAMAGTDLFHEQRFQSDAEAYRRQVNERIDRWDAAHSRGVASYEDRYAGDAVWKAMPAFAQRDVRFSVAWEGAAPALAVLAAWGVGALALVRWSARRVTP